MTPYQTAQLLGRYALGQSITKIARQFNLHPNTVVRTALNHGYHRAGMLSTHIRMVVSCHKSNNHTNTTALSPTLLRACGWPAGTELRAEIETRDGHRGIWIEAAQGDGT